MFYTREEVISLAKQFLWEEEKKHFQAVRNSCSLHTVYNAVKDNPKIKPHHVIHAFIKRIGEPDEPYYHDDRPEGQDDFDAAHRSHHNDGIYHDIHSGAEEGTIEHVFNHLGYDMEHVPRRHHYKNEYEPNRLRDVIKKFPKGNHVVTTEGHIFNIKDGKHIDGTGMSGMNDEVEDVYKIHKRK